MAGHDRVEPIKDSWKITICDKCGALIYWYQSKNGKSYPVSVYSCSNGFAIHRHGNYNNYVDKHDCTEYSTGQLFANIRTISDEIEMKVNDILQQQAITRVLEDFKKSRSAFKKSMYTQAVNFMDGNTKYKNPFSPKQALAVIEYGDEHTNKNKCFKSPKRNVSYTPSKKYKHVLTFEGVEGFIMVNDIDRTTECKLGINGKLHKFHRSYFENRTDLVEWLYCYESRDGYTKTIDGDTINYCLKIEE